jgi:hypothetical protein
MEDHRDQTLIVPMRSERETFSVRLLARPIGIDLDPEFMAFRRIARQSLSPVLNHYVTDRRRSVLTAFTDEPDHPSPFRDIVARIESQEQRKPVSERTAIIHLDKDGLLPQEGSVLVLGGPESHPVIQPIMAKYCGERVVLNDSEVTVMGTSYEGPGVALLVSCHRADRPGSVLTVLYAASQQAVAKVARLLFFYGWNSFVLFKDGAVVSRGEWPLAHDRMEVRLDASSPIR